MQEMRCKFDLIALSLLFFVFLNIRIYFPLQLLVAYTISSEPAFIPSNVHPPRTDHHTGGLFLFQSCRICFLIDMTNAAG